MLSTTACSRGDVILVNFVFTEGSGARRRPAVVVSSEAYQRGRQELILAAITSNVARVLVGDYRIRDWRTAGLLSPSVVTGIIQTIKQSMVERNLGTLSPQDIQAVEDRLRLSLGL